MQFPDEPDPQTSYDGLVWLAIINIVVTNGSRTACLTGNDRIGLLLYCRYYNVGELSTESLLLVEKIIDTFLFNIMIITLGLCVSEKGLQFNLKPESNYQYHQFVIKMICIIYCLPNSLTLWFFLL